MQLQIFINVRASQSVRKRRGRKPHSDCNLLRLHCRPPHHFVLVIIFALANVFVFVIIAIFDKTDFWGLKYPVEVRVQYKTCSTICGTPVPAILNPKNSTRSAGGAKNSQKSLYLVPSKIPNFGCFWPLLPKNGP